MVAVAEGGEEDVESPLLYVRISMEYDAPNGKSTHTNKFLFTQSSTDPAGGGYEAGQQTPLNLLAVLPVM